MRWGQLSKTSGTFSVGRALVELCTARLAPKVGPCRGHERAHFLRERPK